MAEVKVQLQIELIKQVIQETVEMEPTGLAEVEHLELVVLEF